MIFVNDVKKLHGEDKKLVLTMGVFDGVHRGHQHLINECRRLSENEKALSCVMSFHPHPTQILTPTSSVPALFSIQDQKERIADLRVDILVQQKFSEHIAHLSAEGFVKEYLLPLNLSCIVIGYDFRFGAGRTGDFHLLQKYFPTVPITSVSAFDLHGETVSSSSIRQALHDGKIQKANDYLGRTYYLSGVVIHGDKRGRVIGFPTANLQSDVRCLLANGVYVSAFELEGKLYPSITNVGLHPTFANPLLLKKIETHVLDQQMDLYDKQVKVYFYDFLRTEKKFSSVDELKEQISKDIERARGIHAKMASVL